MEYNRSISFEFRRINNLIRRDIERSKLSGEIDSSSCVHGWAIRYLYDNRNSDVFQKDIENEFSIRRSTASNILKNMEKNGLIERVPVSYDARLKKITLTKKAVDIHEKVLKDIKGREERIRKNLSEEEIEAFFAFVDKISENIEC
ncbi:MAG: MarR family transcriptional regulator [Clostridia bacterium]|nr:MarR family transcriptional regulator [Clostridia bacterium]